MRRLIAAGLLAMGLALPVAAHAGGPITICHDVQIAGEIHKTTMADAEAGLNMALDKISQGRCIKYQGDDRWKVLDSNQPFGYAKVVYDTDTKKPKTGYIPWFYAYETGRF